MPFLCALSCPVRHGLLARPLQPVRFLFSFISANSSSEEYKDPPRRVRRGRVSFRFIGARSLMSVKSLFTGALAASLLALGTAAAQAPFGYEEVPRPRPTAEAGPAPNGSLTPQPVH